MLLCLKLPGKPPIKRTNYRCLAGCSGAVYVSARYLLSDRNASLKAWGVDIKVCNTLLNKPQALKILNLGGYHGQLYKSKVLPEPST